MGSYVPSTLQERQEMLESIGLSSIDQLFSHIPDELKLKGELNLPSGMSELEVSSAMKKIAAKNVVFGSIFRGAGAYDHYIPSIVKSVTGKEEFLTAYTPYQAEISQGVLQSIFEYQTMICELTGMDVSMPRSTTELLLPKRSIQAASAAVKSFSAWAAAHPTPLPENLLLGCRTRAGPCRFVGDGKTDLDAMASQLDKKTSACLYLQCPNFRTARRDGKGSRDDSPVGAKLIAGCNPIAHSPDQNPCGAGR